MELRSVISEFVSEYRTTSENTFDFYESNLRNLTTFLDAEAPEVQLLEQVGPLHVRAWLNHELGRDYCIKGKIKQIQPATVEGCRSAARRFFNWCVEQDYLVANPVTKVRPPRLPQRHVVGFDTAEVRRLMKSSRSYMKENPWLGKRDTAIILILLDTGARASELTGLTYDDIDWPRHKILLHGKGAKDRRVPLGDRATRALKEYLEVRPQVPFPELWVTLQKSPMKGKALDAFLKNLGKYADVQDVHAHRFRHTFASNWYRVHRDILALRNLLGHSRIETTQRYLRTLGYDYGTDYGEFANIMDSREWDLV